MRKLFEQARKQQNINKRKRCISLMKLKFLEGKRPEQRASGHDQTLNELLVQMDGISSAEEIKVLVIGATNRIDMLDSLPPGDRLVKVDLPDKGACTY